MQRTFQRMARGNLRDTLGVDIRNEAETREKSERWLSVLRGLGLKPDHLCVEYGCGSLWCAEPIIHYLLPRRFIGFDVTDRFYEFGRRRIGPLLEEKHVRLRVISQRGLDEVAVLRPDFVFSHRVLHHVPRRGLARYMRGLRSLLDEGTTLVIEHRPRPQPGKAAKTRRYSADDLQPHLPRDWVCRTVSFGFVIQQRSA